ncbi:HAD superfamily hydrolase (TIGR01549 family) [Kineococcus xinjiangensis]|uniref:HAD superfamily hydrolase (TIGR01549 family) n=1 Tax=Kineococcus xinjiangensis TaxID=512762 RepID=A0A2S6IDJ4_9ACTN|nr:HAD family hydrolase [Kineococcus xinjiangensis]PPK92292.1 HAD superfamily hydrolase (TIGR01549 family) [Kineococcus xinjiangensis]
MADTAIIDVDGTLVDSNYQHTLAWFRAFRRFDVVVPVWRIHRSIGMGGDQLVPELVGEDFAERHGEDAQEAWVEEFDRLIDEVEPFEGARELLRTLGERGFTVVLASSGKPQHVDRFLDLLDARELCAGWTTSADADATKPSPDLLLNALRKVGGTSGVAVGDSTWDALAAGRADMPSVAVRTGGFSPEELQEAGAVHVAESLPELIAALDSTPLGSPS